MLCRRHFWNFCICANSVGALQTNAGKRVSIESEKWRCARVAGTHSKCASRAKSESIRNHPGRFAMRGFAAAVLTSCALLLASVLPAMAFGTQHAFCLQGGEEYPGLSNCTFDSYAQCQASAS